MENLVEQRNKAISDLEEQAKKGTYVFHNFSIIIIIVKIIILSLYTDHACKCMHYNESEMVWNSCMEIRSNFAQPVRNQQKINELINFTLFCWLNC